MVDDTGVGSETQRIERDPVSLGESFRTWCRVAALSFGGPAGQIAVMHRIIVDEKKWISEERFLHALNYCMLLPGPEAQQLAKYIGWLMHRTIGGLMAGILFVLPGFVSILVLSIIYARYEETVLFQSLFFGLKPAVMAIVLEAVLRIGKRVLKNGIMVSIAAAAFIAIFFFNVPFPVLILVAGAIGFVGGRIAPVQFAIVKGHAPMNARQSPVEEIQEFIRTDTQPTLKRSLAISVVCLTLWFGPLVLIGSFWGPQSVLLQEGLFFSKAAVVTFGGAYSVLEYVAQQAVEKFGWLKPGEMLDGLGMAETTPGPLIMVVQFVGFMGAYRHPGPFDPLLAGVLGSIVTTWVTFVPCFFWIYLGAPYIERLRGNRLLSAALSAITASVVGVVLNLAVWFSVHTLFSTVETRTYFPLRMLVPDFSTLNVAALGIAILACMMTFYWKKGMVLTLLVSAMAGLVFRYWWN